MYCALYRKWRPKFFYDIVGQEHVVKTLKNQVQNNKLSHAYLFTGCRGTGKTTCAKILAKAANCVNLKDGNPCNQCDICQGIDNGSIMDILEIDAASNNGVENIRELREETNFTPTVCKYRVYIIDEVHMLSVGAFNALLKIMEEPPSYVMFILATTEVNKVPATILSRCQQFNFNKINKQLILERLMLVAKSENIKLEEQAAKTISKFANGGLRDALSVLDACVSLSENNNINTQVVSEVLCVLDVSDLVEIAKNIINKDIKLTLKLIEDITSKYIDPLKLMSQIIEIFKNIMLLKTLNPNISDSEELNDLENLTQLEFDDLHQLKLLADSVVDTQEIFYILDVLSDGYNKILKSSSKQLELELAIIKSVCNKNKNNLDNNFNQNGLLDLKSKIKNLEMQINNLQKLILSSDAAQLKIQSIQNSSKNSNINNNLNNNFMDKSLYESAKKIECWNKVLNILSNINPGLCAALQDSSGYLNETAEIIFIKTDNSFFLDLIRTNKQAKQTLKQAIFEVFGKKYRIGPYKINTDENQNQNLISDIENLAVKNNLNLDIN